MRGSRFPGRILLVATLLGACGDSNQAADVVQMTAAGDTLLTSYGEIADAAWLSDQRWAILGQPEETVAIVDFARKASGRLGAQEQVRNPSAIFVAEDTLYVGDWGLRRLSLWGPGGRLARTIPAPDVARGALPQARDSAGRYYLDLYPRPRPDGSGNRDSAALVRTNSGLTALDTIARLAPLEVAEVVSQAGRRFERRVFSGNDHWGVLPDGSVWVARVYENRLDWRSPSGQWTRGEPLPDRVLEVTRYDRELFIRRFPPELRRTARELPFAVIKPPFEAGITAPSGEVWLEKSRAPADSARRYHVVSRDGRLVREVRLQGQGRIVALGPGRGLIAEPVPEGTRLIATNFATQLAER